jgi:hypothetical protein
VNLFIFILLFFIPEWGKMGMFQKETQLDNCNAIPD